MKVSRRAITTTLSGGVLVAALLLPLPDFLQTLLTSGAVGGIVWGLVDFITELKPNLSGDGRYAWAIGLSLVLPPLAYAAQVAFYREPFTPEGFWAAVGVAFATASTMHRTAEKAEREARINDQLATWAPPTPTQPPGPTPTAGDGQ